MSSVARATPAFSEGAREHGRCEGSGQDIDEVVAEKDRSDQALAVLSHFERARGATFALPRRAP